jgi:hypothetical protein
LYPKISGVVEAKRGGDEGQDAKREAGVSSFEVTICDLKQHRGPPNGAIMRAVGM